MKKLDFKKQLDLYLLLQDKIKEAARANQYGTFLNLANTEEMARTFSLQKKIYWRQAQALMRPMDLDSTFATLWMTVSTGPLVKYVNCAGHCRSGLPCSHLGAEVWEESLAEVKER